MGALDIFTGKKNEDLCPTSHNLEVPFVKRTEYQLLTADNDSGEVSLLLESGEPKDEDKKVVEDIMKGVDDGKTVSVVVQSACGMEKIIQCKTSDAWALYSGSE